MKNKALILALAVLCLSGCNNSEQKAPNEQISSHNAVFKSKIEESSSIELTDAFIKDLNKDGRPIVVDTSIALTSSSDTPLTVPIFVLGGETINISGVVLDGEHEDAAGIIIDTAESNIDIHGNSFLNYRESGIHINENKSENGRRYISIYENEFVNWGEKEGPDGAIGVNQKTNSEILFDIQNNHFKTEHHFGESAFVYNDPSNSGNYYENSIVVWSSNNVIDVEKDGLLNLSIENRDTDNGMGAVFMMEENAFVVRGENTCNIAPNTSFRPWLDIVIEEGVDFTIDGTLILGEENKLINKGSVHVSETGNIEYQDASQIIGLQYNS